MAVWRLADLDRAVLRGSWAAAPAPPTTSRVRVGTRATRPGATATSPPWLVVQDVYGGVLTRGEVRLDGTACGCHWWNRLPSGADIDLTRERFRCGQAVSAGRALRRPPGPLPRREEDGQPLRRRVRERLGRLLIVGDDDGSAE